MKPSYIFIYQKPYLIKQNKFLKRDLILDYLNLGRGHACTKTYPLLRMRNGCL
jgi:hypothetical protein